MVGAFQYTWTLNLIDTYVQIACVGFLVCEDAACRTVLGSWYANAAAATSGPPSYSIPHSSFYFSCPLCDQCPGWVMSYYLTVYSYSESDWIFEDHMPHNSTGLSSSNATIPYASGLCQKPWTGITCRNGLIESIQLLSLGLTGELPTEIGLLRGLTALDLSSNALGGTIPESMTNLFDINEMLLTNNYLTGTIPSGFRQLRKLVFLDIAYNKFNGTVPIVFSNMTNLAVIYADANSFSGQISSDICTLLSERNATLSLKNCPTLACYQAQCWGGSPSLRKALLDDSISVCAPTQSPTTSLPTRTPTYSPTIRSVITVKDSASASSETTVIVTTLCSALLIGVCFLIGWWRRFSKKAHERRRAEARLRELPIHSTLLSRGALDHSSIQSIVEANLETSLELDYFGRTAMHIILHGLNRQSVSADIIATLLLAALGSLNDTTLDQSNRDGAIGCAEDALVMIEGGQLILTQANRQKLSRRNKSVVSELDDWSCKIHILSKKIWALAVQDESELMVAAVELVLQRYGNRINMLANMEDEKGRACKDIACSHCRESMLRRLNLHERDELKNGQPVHKSVTSLIVLAKDCIELISRHAPIDDIEVRVMDGPGMSDDCRREVVLKFMKHRCHYRREVETRAISNFDSKYVIPLLETYDSDRGSDDDVKFFQDAAMKGFQRYPYCVVMEAAPCNLKFIMDQQLICGKDWEQIRVLSRQLTQCLEHLHDKGVVHGEIKREYMC